MREIAFDEKNFAEVLRLTSICETSIGTDRPQQIHFNEITQKFEYYSPEEFDSIPEDMMFEHPGNIIEKYIETKNNMANAVAETDRYAGSDMVDDETDESFDRAQEELEQRMVDTEIEDIKDSLGPIFENDDPEVLKSTTENLKVINGIRARIQTEQRESLARVIADLYKCDTISESDVALSLVENNEYKKLLSMLFSMLNVSVSSTRVSQSLEVSSGSLTFNPRIEYALEDYRRGAAQCLADVRRLAESGEKIHALEDNIRELNSNLASTRKELVVAQDKNTELVNQRYAKKDQNLLQPVSFVIGWKKNGADRFLRIKDKAKLGDDGSYPTKYLERTSSIDKAATFNEEQAKLQLVRMIKHKDNLTFVDLKSAGIKGATEFFSIYRTTIEKV